MNRIPTTRGKTWVGIGLTLALVHIVLLSGVALFNDGRVAADWIETLPWLALVAAPALLAGAGFRNPTVLPWAAGISLPLALLSLAGATLPLLLPAMFYLLGYAAAEQTSGAAR